MSDDHPGDDGTEPLRDPLWSGGQDTDAGFVALAGRALDTLLLLAPDEATSLGDHRFDHLLPDLSDEGAARAQRELGALLAEVDSVDDLALGLGNGVDLEILRSRLAATEFDLHTLRTREWDPLRWNPGTACYLLLARDFAPLADRLDSLRGRLRSVPDFLAAARDTLADMPEVHVETALGQLDGTIDLLGGTVDDALAALRADPAADPAQARVDPQDVADARDLAVAALHEHRAWLAGRLGESTRDPRLGPERYAAALWHTLDEPLSPDELLARAEGYLEVHTRAIESLAAQYLGVASAGPDQVREALARCADGAPVDDRTVLDLCRADYQRLARFTADEHIVTVHDDPVEIVEMPEIHRGVAVAYCDPPGPLETASLPTFFAVAPTPHGWDAARVRSFYREYNGHLLHDLSAHEGVPGHVLQLSHARRARTDTPVRTAWWSGPFVEGWAVYAEGLVLDHGYDGEGGDRGRLALELTRTKMLLRTTINAILDVRVHTRGLTETDAMALMTARGFQEEGEAAGKWRRALLTHAQLSTYFVGHTEVTRIAADLAAARPAWSERQRHDAMLSHGSPGPRHLRVLLDLPD